MAVGRVKNLAFPGGDGYGRGLRVIARYCNYGKSTFSRLVGEVSLTGFLFVYVRKRTFW